MVEAMNVCAVPFEPGVDELRAAGLTAAAGVKVPSPWIAEAPAAFECRHHTTLGVGNSREIILGEVVYAHFRAEVVDAARLHVDAQALDAVGRMGGHGYASTRDRFDLPTMSVETWLAQKAVRPGTSPGLRRALAEAGRGREPEARLRSKRRAAASSVRSEPGLPMS